MKLTSFLAHRTVHLFHHPLELRVQTAMFETALAFPQDPVYIVKERKFPETAFVSSELKSTQQIFDLNIFYF